MEINTTRFGKIEIDNNKKITFRDGILGFEELKEYILISSNDSFAFHWLQSIDNPNIAIACMDPLNVCNDFSPLIEEDTVKQLQIDNIENVLLLCVVVIPTDIMKTTINLAAPIIINTINNKGLQVVLQNDAYELRHLVFKCGEGV